MKPLARLLTVAVVACCLISPAHADRRSRAEEKARQERFEQQRQQVEYILQQEYDGQLTDRKQALKRIIASGDAPSEAYWQAGYIHRGDEWVSVGDRWLTPQQEQMLQEYTKARSNAVDTDEGHYKLAQWCVENGFNVQAYGHLKAVLLNHPDHGDLRQLLGYQKIGNRWINAEEFLAAVREADRLAKELHEWGPKVIEICDGLNTPVKWNQMVAANQLKKITQVSAIPVMELILLPSSDAAASACVEQLCQINHRRSSIALCKAAMLLPDSSSLTKLAAIEELKTRPREDFVPVLLSEIQTPMAVECRFIKDAGREFSHGPFNLPNKYHIEKTKVITKFQLTNHTMYELRNISLDLLFADCEIHDDMFVRNGAAALPYGWELHRKLPTLSPKWRAAKLKYAVPRTQGLLSLQDQYLCFQYFENVEKLAADGALYSIQVNRNIAQQNDRIRDFTERVTHLLGQIEETSREESPEYWWAWWKKRIEVDPDRKMVRNIHEEVGESLHLAVSCFVAGTPVWTDLGPRPIEQLKVGDMALAQDVETGELMYRPIIRTTTRKPKPLVTIDLGAEEITATGGHPFFVVGEGWVRARELQAGQFLHTPTGTIKIDRVKETPEDETYNLVVDGFHTYFVGMSQALVHDVSITSPTDAVVPGLLDR